MKTETVLFETITPWPEPVNLAELLTDIEAVIKRHVILSDHAAAALAVWVLHTYTFELRDTVAYVAIESPEKRCGKTTLLSVLAAMAHRPLISSNITVGALFRAIHNCSPTLFIDEADTFLAGNGAMRGIINSGNTRRTAYVLRLVGQASRLSESRKVSQAFPKGSLPPIGGEGRGEGATAAAQKIPEPTAPGLAPESLHTSIKKFSCWCPKVIALIGEAPDTIADRSIVVKMARKLTTETCAPLSELECNSLARQVPPPPEQERMAEGRVRVIDSSLATRHSSLPKGEACVDGGRHDGSLAPSGGEGWGEGAFHTTTGVIKSKCARFALDARQIIAQSPKITGPGLNDRAADTFDPLYVIARHAGAGWEEKLHAAALALSTTADTEKSGAGLILDILDIFADTHREKMFSRDIVAQLREGGMKSQTLKDSAINEFEISKTLRQYHIRPSILRIGKEVSRGYLGSDFRDALTRYVSEAEVQVRIRDIQHRWKLQDEARTQAQKEAEIRQQLMAKAFKDKKLGPEAWALLDQLNSLKHSEDSASPPPAEYEKPPNVPA